MDEVPIIARALTEHCAELSWPSECECGRGAVRGLPEHQAEEIVLALREAGMGVFMFERLGLLEDDLP